MGRATAKAGKRRAPGGAGGEATRAGKQRRVHPDVPPPSIHFVTGEPCNANPEEWVSYAKLRVRCGGESGQIHLPGPRLGIFEAHDGLWWSPLCLLDLRG